MHRPLWSGCTPPLPMIPAAPKQGLSCDFRRHSVRFFSPRVGSDGLFRRFKGVPMGMGFLASQDSLEDEEADPVGPAQDQDPVAMLTEEAVRLGFIKEGDKPDQMLVAFWMSAIDASAAIADQFRDPENDEHTVGDIIRAHLNP